jgi:hypothetical protein
MVCAGWRSEGAVEDYVMPRVASGKVVWVCGMGVVAQAFSSVVGPSTESVGVVGVKAVGYGEAENGGAYETVAVGDGCPDSGWGFVPVWGCAGNVGWMGGRGVVPLDAGPHCCFGLHFRFG